jgi:hypothetical protein
MRPSYKSYSNRSYLAKEDFPVLEVHVVEEIKEELVKAPGKPEKPKLVVYFDGLEKGLVLNQANGAVLEAMVKAANPGIKDPDNPKHWVGLRIEIFADPNVMFGNERVGGLRLRPAAEEPIPY